MEKVAKIILTHWMCGDGCCSDSKIEVHYGEEEFTDFGSWSQAAEFCADRGWKYTTEEVYE